MNRDYSDLLFLPHHTSPTRKRMSLYDRAAQFAAFQALTGFEDAVEETARLTDAEIFPDEDVIAGIDRKLKALADHPGEKISLIYFKPDEKKAGGAYLSVSGTVKKIDPVQKLLLFTDGTAIPLGSITELF